MRPVPPVKIVGFKQKSEDGVSISAMIILKDAEGKHFTGSFAYFTNELSIYNPIQDMSFNTWCELRRKAADAHPRRWFLRDETADARKELYLAGHPADEFTI